MLRFAIKSVVGLGTLCLLMSESALAQNCGSYPYNSSNGFSNGSVADAAKLYSDFTYLSGCAASTSGPVFIGYVDLTSTSSAGNIPVLTIENTSGATSGSFGPSLVFNNHVASTSPFIVGELQGASSQAGNVGIGMIASSQYALQANGVVAGNGAYFNTSDARLKRNIRPIENALAMIEQIQAVRFEWRPIGERTVGKALELPALEPQVGFVAQNLEKVLPEAVSTAKDTEGLKSVAESKVVPVLVEAVK